MAFLKQASLKIENPDVGLESWPGNKSSIKTAANKIIEYKKILADFHPNDYLLTHCTIVASVDVESASVPINFASEKSKKEYKELEGRFDYFITPKTSKYVNANGDSWSRELLKKSYRTFIGAENYVEHVQDPSLSKGKILDAVARQVDDNNSIFIDILVATNKKHKDLVNKIKTGDLKTLSMGAVVAFTICTKCGRLASDETELCSHIRFLKKNNFISENDGKKRIIAELCGHFLYPESNKFIEGSWVETPAFKGAVLRGEVNVHEVDKIGFTESIEPLLAALNIGDSELSKTAFKIVQAFKIVDNIKNSFNVSSKTEEEDLVKDVPLKDELVDDKPEEDEEEISKDDTEKSIEDTPADEPEEETDSLDTPADEPAEDTETVDETSKEEERVPEELPEEIQEMSETPSNEEISPEQEEKIDIESKKPYDILKKEIKDQLKDQIKKELLKDLGISFDEPSPAPLSGLTNVNLNDTLVRSSLNRVKEACVMSKKVGLRNISKHGFEDKDVLKIAELSGKYSINKEVFKILESLNILQYPTYRRISKEIECKLGRELNLSERANIDTLIKDLFK